MTLSKLLRVLKSIAKTWRLVAASVAPMLIDSLLILKSASSLLLVISAAASLLMALLLILGGPADDHIFGSYSSSIIKLVTLQYILFFAVIDLQKLKRPIAITLGFGSIAAIMLALFYLRHTSDIEALPNQHLLILCMTIAAGFYLGAENST